MGGLATTLLVVALAFWGISPASANVDSGTELRAVSGAKAEAKLELAVAALADGGLVIHSSEGALATADASIYSIGTAKGEFTSVTIPVQDDYSLLSNFTIVFDNTENIAQYSEMLVTKNEANNFNITSYSDGSLVSSQDTDVAFVSDAEMKNSLENTGGVSTMAKNTGACLGTVLGVGGVTGALIAWACAGSCAAAAIGVGVPFCVACIAAYATIGGASITAVASCF